MKMKIIIVLFLLVAGICYSQISVNIIGPSSCSMNGEIEVRVEVEVSSAGIQELNVKLYEADWILSQRVGEQSVRIPAEDWSFFAKTFTFRFLPTRFEKNKRLEVYANVSGTRTKTIYIYCM